MTRMGDEQVQALEWARGLLVTDEALADAAGVLLADLPEHVHSEVAPADAPEPWIVLATPLETTDRAAVGPADRISTVVPLDVRATRQGRSYDDLAPVARAIYNRLHARTNDALAEGGMMLCAKRTGGIQYPERTDGIDYRHLGHTFQVEIN